MSATILRAECIHKWFGAIHALDGVDFEIRGGEVHAVVGENGAGKSTLMKVIAGVYPPDSGHLVWEDGKLVSFKNPREAYEKGIRIVHQEFSLFPNLTVSENIYLGQSEASFLLKLTDKRHMDARASKLLATLGIDIDASQRVSRLSTAQRQLVEIARALHTPGRVLIMDEPTSALTSNEVERLFKVISGLRSAGMGVVFISHRLPEILPIADRITVMRDGKIVGTELSSRLSIEAIVGMMVGHSIGSLFPKRAVEIRDRVLSIRNLSGRGFRNVTFDVHAGEILGLTGLMGSGRTELARAIFGADKRTEGRVLLFGSELTINTVADAIKSGIAYVTEDRQREGICRNMPVAQNIVLANTGEVYRRGIIRKRKFLETVTRSVAALRVVTNDPFRQLVSQLSGGNQQKVVLAKWFESYPKVLIADEPTRGIDVATKAEIHRLMGDYVAQGNCIILISSDLPEVLSMSDRVLVMRNGEVVGEFPRHEATEEVVTRCAMGL
ncbi:MAG: sugar ABC transporter ATP-binding protein [Bacillota bacterium]